MKLHDVKKQLSQCSIASYEANSEGKTFIRACVFLFAIPLRVYKVAGGDFFPTCLSLAFKYYPYGD